MSQPDIVSERRLPAAVPTGVQAGVMALALALAALWLWRFPLPAWPLAVLLSLACLLVYWRPVWLFALIPALFAVLDLAPWSGRRWLTEFDVLLALGWTIAWLRTPAAAGRNAAQWSALSLAASAAFALLAVALLRSASLWPALDADAFSNPLSPFNGLRLAKGALAALALWRLALRMRRHALDPVDAFGWGMVIGLAANVAVVLAERLAFSWLLDFANDYRVSGLFSAMSLGGAYIECHIAVALPFLVQRLLPPVSAPRVLLGALLLAGAVYAQAVTYSRGGYAAAVLGSALVVGLSLLPRGPRFRRAAFGGALAALAIAAALPVLTGKFAQQRLANIEADLGTRERQWAEVLQTMDHDTEATWLGMGLGRFAEVHILRSKDAHQAGGHRLLGPTEGGPAVRLGLGYAYFVEQVVAVEPGALYQLRYRARANGAGGQVTVVMCQKWIIASFDCSYGPSPDSRIGHDRKLPAQAWQDVAHDIVAPGAGPGHLPRPVRFTLQASGHATVDVSAVSLRDAQGRELIGNGSFADGLDHWTFTSDNHLAWHAKSMPLGLYYELGLLGLAAFVALWLAGAWRALQGARQGVDDAAALLAASCAFAAVGVIDTLVDDPRMLMLWLLLCLLPSALAPAAAAAAVKSR